MENILRELICPLTLELLEDPIQLPCCGKACGRAALSQALDSTHHSCPLCRGDLTTFNVAAAATNRVLAAMVESIRGSSQPVPLPEHVWSASVQRLADSPVAQLKVNLRKSKFPVRKTLFIAVMDKSGSMDGHPWSQVQTALYHIIGAAWNIDTAEISIIAYDSGAQILPKRSRPEDARKDVERITAGGGTNFLSAFNAIDKILQERLSAADSNIGSVTIAFLTDGQASEAHNTLVPKLCSIMQEYSSFPTCVHAIGFSRDCDKALLEGLRLAGSVEGTFRYAEPSDPDDALCNKMTSIFDFACQGSTVPVLLSLPEGAATFLDGSCSKSVQMSTDKRRNGAVSIWVLLQKCASAQQPADVLRSVKIHSCVDTDVEISISPVAQPQNDLMSQWLRYQVDVLAQEALTLSKAKLGPQLLALHAGLLLQRISAIASAGLADARLGLLEEQVRCICEGKTINEGKLSDMRFASMFATTSPAQPKAPRIVEPLQVPVAAAATMITQWKEKDVRYTFNNNLKGRNPLQCGIMQPAAKGVADSLAQMISASQEDELSFRDGDGNTALHLAAYCGRFDVVQLLAARHPTVTASVINSENAGNETPATLAIKRRGYHKTLGALIAAGASIPADRLKPLNRYAIDHGFVRTATILSEGGDQVAEVDMNMTESNIRFQYTRGTEQHLKMDVAAFLKVALARHLVDIVHGLMEQHGATLSFSLFMDYCFPPKPDDPQTPSYIDLIKYVLGRQPELLHQKTAGGDTPLIRAVERGSLPHVQFLLCAVRVDEPNELGNTALWVACAKRYPCIIDELINAGANVNWANAKGNVPLSNICQMGPLKVAERLIAAGAQTEHVNSNGDTLILLAARNGQHEVLQYLLNFVSTAHASLVAHIDGFNALFASVESDKAECVRVLADFGMELNQRTASDNKILANATPMHLAAFYGRESAMRMLIERKAHVDEQDSSQMTPLHIAVVRGHLGIVRLLRSAGADAAARDARGNTPLSYCRSREDIRRVLVDPAADALIHFARCGFKGDELKSACEIISQHSGVLGLLSCGKAMDVKGRDGYTPLMHAVIMSNFEAVSTLVKLGADPEICCPRGLSCQVWAQWTRNPRIQQLLGTPKEPLAPTQRLLTVSSQTPENQQVLFLSPQTSPPQGVPAESTIASRMRRYVNSITGASESNVKLIADVPAVPLIQLNQALGGVLWEAKVSAVAQVASSCVQVLSPAEIVSIHSYTSNEVVPTMVCDYLMEECSDAASIKPSIPHTLLKHVVSALRALPPFVGEVFFAADNANRSLFGVGTFVRWPMFLSSTSLWPVATDSLKSFTSGGTVFLVHSQTGRSVSTYSQHPYDCEVIFFPHTAFRVAAWYRGDVIALGQANIREHTFGMKDAAQAEMLRSSTKPLIIELEELEEGAR